MANKHLAKLKPADFVHLHNHTHYSLLDGLTKIPGLVSRVKELEMDAVAITDHGTLSGLVEFYKEAKQAHLKPILGIETYVAPRSHDDRDPAKDKTPFHLILLAMNSTGYQNLMRLSTIANLEGFYYKPRIDHDDLAKHNEGLMVLSGCIGGEVGDALRGNQYEQAKAIASWYQSIFGDRYYLEIQDHGHPDHPTAWKDQIEVTTKTFQLAEELGIPCVVTCDAHYLHHNDQEAHEILLCVQTGSFLSDNKRMSLKDFELHLTSPEEIIKRWGTNHPELITNTRAIAERCSVELELGKILIPTFPLPKGQTEKKYLQQLVYRGLAWRYTDILEAKAEKLDVSSAKAVLPKPVLERAEFELKMIDKMGFNGFFLIVSDFIVWGKKRGIMFGPGRGSAAGSIVSYAARITELDPLAHKLLFERFLNPDRISMPDFDIDIQDNRRDEVIKYCADKYGGDRVANIVTFGTMAARNAVRDVSRVLEVPYAEADRLAKMIPTPVQGRHTPLRKSISEVADLSHEYRTNATAKRVVDLATQLEGTIRSHGVHAAGVVITPDEMVKFVPLEKAQKGVVATQYPFGIIEDLGLLKIDFLGLSNLTIIKNTLRIIKKVYEKTIDITSIPTDDAKTFELLAAAYTTGVFQLESAGMKRYLKELKPTSFDDITAMVALYRPGPIQWIEDFIARKHGQRAIEYLHPTMKEALTPTYGIIVYQEQVMEISKTMCGFTGGQADTLRKGIAKKRPEVLASLKREFTEGAITTSGVSRDMVEKFWAQLEAFAAYCFPKAHAACYAQTAYQTAYLKAHYPAAFMAALMTSDYDNTDRLSIEISESQRMGLQVLPPDVNQSFVEFAVVPDSNDIRFGLSAVKNVGTGAVEEILRAREETEGFTTLEQFLSSVNPHTVNRKAVESLIKAGAFDSFAPRGTLLTNLDTMLAYAARRHRDVNSGQTGLFGDGTESLVSDHLLLEEGLADSVELIRQQIIWERELLGIYLSKHPLDEFETFLSEQAVPLRDITHEHDGMGMSVGGAVVEVREITTKNGQKMAFVKLADKTDELELVIFPSVFQKTAELWRPDHIIIAEGTVNSRSKSGETFDSVKILVNSARHITPTDLVDYKSTGQPKLISARRRARPAVVQQPILTTRVANERLYLRLNSSEQHELLTALKGVIDERPGNTDVVLVLGPSENKQAIKLPMTADCSHDAIDAYRQLLGDGNVVLK